MDDALTKVIADLEAAEAVLRRIANEDYRGPEPEARRLARTYFEEAR